MDKFLETIKNIEPADKDSIKRTWHWLDNLTKPIGSLGMLEEIAAKVSGITGELFNSVDKRNIIIMCSDNGVVEEGVSCCPQETTRTVTENFTKGITGVCVLSRFYNTDLTVIDIGVKADFNNSKIINRKIAYGTKNMIKGPAMTREQAIEAVNVGIDMVDNLKRSGYKILGTGEMGIGNTTTSAAVLSVLSGLSPDITAGKGSGLTEVQFEHKKEVIREAIYINNPDKQDVLDVLAKVGGFDIAGLCGCFLGAAKNKLPIVIDGFIASVAALCACRLNNNVKDYIFPSHLSAEPGAVYVMEELNLKPILNLNMRLGEGSGCPLTFDIIEAALYTMKNMGTFEDANIKRENYVDIRH